MDATKKKNLLEEIGGYFETSKSWTDAYDMVFGVNGVLATALTIDERREFEALPEHAALHLRLAQMHNLNPEAAPTNVIRVVTVRMPKEVHAALRAEAHERKTSMNKLCVAKLIQPIDSRLVPNDSKLPVAS